MLFHNKIQSLHQLQNLLQNDPNHELLNWFKNDPIEAIREITEEPGKDFKEYNIHSLQDVEKKMYDEPSLRERIKSDPDGFVRYMVKETISPEHRLNRIVITSLCCVVIVIILGVLAAWFVKNSREAPTLVTAVACTSLGLLAGMFVRVSARSGRKIEPSLP
jgi:hypothetical protein